MASIVWGAHISFRPASNCGPQVVAVVGKTDLKGDVTRSARACSYYSVLSKSVRQLCRLQCWLLHFGCTSVSKSSLTYPSKRPLMLYKSGVSSPLVEPFSGFQGTVYFPVYSEVVCLLTSALRAFPGLHRGALAAGPAGATSGVARGCGAATSWTTNSMIGCFTRTLGESAAAFIGGARAQL